MSNVARLFSAQRHERQKDDLHLAWIRTLPCLICGDDVSVEATHIRYRDPTVAKRETGIGEKPDDKWTVPLCGEHHRQQHAGNEQSFWIGYHLDPIKVAAGLWINSGDTNTGFVIINNNLADPV